MASPAPVIGRQRRVAHREEQLADFTRDPRIILLSLFALVIGAASAFVAWALVWLIGAITNLAYYHRLASAFTSPAGNHLGWAALFVPIVGGLVVGVMARFGSEKIRGHGIPEALEAILVAGSRMEARVALLKPLSSAISIGTGGPFGAEGPIIMTGGACGSLFAQLFDLSAAERKTLLVAGASAGMAAIFATPLAANLLAVELLLFEWRPRSFIPVALASAVAAAMRTPLLGAGPIFPVARQAAMPAQTLAFAVVVGLGAGLASTLLTVLVYGCEDLFLKLPLHWMWWPAIGGLFVGVAGLVDPRVLGVGYDVIGDLLRGRILGAALVTLVVAKALAWAVALGSGTSGGVLAPLLMIGGALGALASGWLRLGDPGLGAMIGMAAIMAGTMRSPFSAVVFAIELTHDMEVLLALVVACFPAVAVTVLLLRRSILTEKVARHGHHLTREYAPDPLEVLLVGDVMDSSPPCVDGRASLSELSDRIARGDPELARHQAVLVVDDAGALAGILTRGDVMRVLRQDARTGATVLDAATKRDLAVAYPDETVRTAVARLLDRNVGRLPVVSRAAPRQVVGYFGRTSALDARRRWMEEESLRTRGGRGHAGREPP